MKKLLSICFLSILLGLLSFSAQAQNCSGFWIENLQPETFTGVANAPSGDGTLVLDHVLKPAYVDPVTLVGNTDLYELHFCPCGLDPKTKISVDWLLYRDGELVNDNLYDYVDQFEIYTLYPELNQQGVCQSIHWLGGAVPAEWGFCTPQAPADMFSGVTSCNPTNYPGAMQVGQGTPGSVLSPLGLQVPAQGEFSIYSNNFDYFYMDFFTQTRTVVRIKWRQVGNYSLVMRIRQQNGGTAYDFGWGENPEIDKVGGHQSCCGPILAQDSIHYLITGDFSKEVCENDAYNFGTIDDRCNENVIEETFTTTVPDTMVLFGHYDPATCCDHLVVDSVYNFHFFQRNTPTAIVKDTTLCQCTELDAEGIINMVGYDQEDSIWATNRYLLWYQPADDHVVEIGEGTATTGYLPVYVFYNHSYSQQIYTAEEVGAGTVKNISFYHSGSAKSVDFQIYLSHTSKSSFASNSDWDLSEKTLVYQGTVVLPNNDWVEFPFNQSEFDFDGESNLLVTVIGDDSWESGHSFRQDATPDNSYMSIYKYRDGDPYTNENITTSTSDDHVGYQNYRNIVRFEVSQVGAWLDEPVVKPTDVVAAEYEYTVRQVNEYANFDLLDGSKKDTVICYGDPQTFTITIDTMMVTLPDNAEFCVGDFTDTTVVTIIAEHVNLSGEEDQCATTTLWYAAGEDGADLSEVIFEGDTFVLTKEDLSEYFNFEENKRGEVVFYAVAYNANLDCTGKIFTPYTITFNQTPVLVASLTPEDLVCPGSDVEMQVTINNNPLQVVPAYNYYWLGVDSAEASDSQAQITAEIADNDQTDKSRAYVPDYNYYQYSYTQQIYTAAEIGAAGIINGVSFNLTDAPQPRDIEIYLSTTDKDYFVATGYDYYYDDISNDWDLNSNKVLVYSGSVPFELGWNDIQFDTPFEYNGSENLLLTVVDVTGSWNDNTMYYSTSTTSDYMAISRFRDYYSLDNENIEGQNGYPLDYRNDIRLDMVVMDDGMKPYEAPSMDTVFAIEGSTHNMSDYLPYCYLYKNSYCQQIYTSDDIVFTGTIDALYLNFAGEYGITDNTKFEVYLAPTTKTSFASTTDWELSDDMVMVYTGVPQFENGWNEIPFIAPYEYDGESNLMVTIIVNNSNWQNHNVTGNPQKFYEFSGPSNTAMYIRSDGTSYDNNNITGKTGSLVSKRNEIAFNFTTPVVPPYCAFMSNSKTNTAKKVVDPTCGTDFDSYVYVVDAKGCKSNTVHFEYTTGDTVKPAITPAMAEVSHNTCDSATLAEWADDNYAFTTAEALDSFLKTLNNQNATTNPYGVYDECNLLKVTYSDVYYPMGDNCEIKIVRTFTVTDSCQNDSTFVLTIIGHDEDAPVFTFDRPIRLIPVAAGDCTYDAPSLETMKEKIRPYVSDACTDVDYLMSHIEFFWENTTIDPAGTQNIFIEKNHLTITGAMTDKCGNTCDTIQIFFLDRPDDMYIEENDIQPRILCFGDTTVTLTFDPATIVDDIIAGPYTPYTYEWIEVDGKNVTFSNPTELTTKVFFGEGGQTYHIVMKVTNSNDCDTVSAVREFYVRPELQVTLEPIVLNGATEPYCPNYGNLTVEATVVGDYESIDSYVWSGESVNVLSKTNRSYVKIVPENCDHLYDITVDVLDDRGCPGTATRYFQVAADAPVFTTELDNDTVVISDGCTTLVPNYMSRITPDVIFDDCYSYSEIIANEDWYTQEPAANTPFNTATQEVTITIKNPCGKPAEVSFLAVKPANFPSVTVTPESAGLCYESYMNDGIQFYADAQNVGVNPTYKWTIDDDNAILGNSNYLDLNAQIWEPENEEVVHTLTVQVTNNQNGCTITQDVPLTIHYQGDPVYTRTWKNTMCGGLYNGMIAVDTLYQDYEVTVVGWDVPNYYKFKINDVPHHNPTPYNSAFFDSLRSGTYYVEVRNDHGCAMGDYVYVGDSTVVIPEPLYEVVDQSECIANGSITITPNAAYTYELYNDLDQQIIGTDLVFSNLASGNYYIKAIDNATTCDRFFNVYIDNTSVPEVIEANAEPRTDCQTANGKITVTSDVEGMRYRIAKNGTSSSNAVYYPTQGIASVEPEWLYGNSGYPYQTYYYQTSNIFEGLAVGEYTVIAYNPATGCHGFATVEVENGIEYPDFEIATTPNNYCAGTVYNGTITVTPAAGQTYTYTLKKSQGGYAPSEVIPATETGVFTGLQHYDRNGGKVYYQLTVTDPATHCSAEPVRIEIAKDFYYPDTASISKNPNAVCDATIATMDYNGSVTFNITATGANVGDGTTQMCTYTVVLHDKLKNNNVDYWTDDWNGANGTNYGYVEVSQNDEVLAHLSIPYGQYILTQNVDLLPGVEATFIYRNNSSLASYRAFEIYDPNGEVVWSKDYNEMTTSNTTYTLPVTPSCGGANTITPSQAFNQYIKDYTITITGLDVDYTATNTFSTTDATFNNLDNGSYSAKITSAYNCFVTRAFEIERDPMPALQLQATADHFCAPTFEKPGNGTIKILAPTDETNPGHFYEYNFYAQGDMLVPYLDPLTHTAYWLEHKQYRVEAFEPATGCVVSDVIDVPYDPYIVTVRVDPTPSTYCSATSGDGTVTITATSTNPDAEFAYSLDGVNWQTSNYFDELPYGTYIAYAMDTKTSCAGQEPFSINPSECKPEITIVDQNGNTAPFEYCIGSEGDQICANAFYPLGSSCQGTFTYNWEDECFFRNINDPCIDILIDHPMPNGCYYTLHVTNTLTGCTYDSVVKVHVYPKPVIGFKVNNGNPIVNPEQPLVFCENDPISIDVVCLNGETLVNDQTVWTHPESLGIGLHKDIIGTDYTDDYATFCVYSHSEHGCRSDVATLSITFIRIAHTNVDTVSCTNFDVPGVDEVVVLPVGETYPYETNFPATYQSVITGCDSIVNYHITLISTPVFTQTPTVTPFCEGEKTLADFESAYAVYWNGNEDSEKWTVDGTVVTSDQIDLTYDFVTNHTIKRVATNRCGSVESILDLSDKVYKQPTVHSFVAGNGHCAGESYAFKATVSTYGTSATAELYIEGNTTPLATATVNGLNKTITFDAVTLPWAYNNKHIQLRVENNTTPSCDPVTVDSILVVDTAKIEDLANSNTYCVGDQMTENDFSGIVPSSYSSLVLKVMAGNAPASNDDVIDLPYTFTNRSLNGKKVYFVASNRCYNNIVSNAVTLKVDSMPQVAKINNIDVCAEYFELNVPKIDTKGSAILSNGQGWLLKGENGFAPSTVAAIKAAAVDHIVEAAYYATNSCGSDTATFTVLVNDKPNAQFVGTVTMCPNKVINTIITDEVAKVTFHNILGVPGVDNVKYFVAKSAGVRDVVNVSTLTFQDIADYDELWVIANNPCGSDSAMLSISVLTNDHEDLVVVDTCKGSQLRDFIVGGERPEWTGTAPLDESECGWFIRVNNSSSPASLETIINQDVEVGYKWVTMCEETFEEWHAIHVLETPTVAISADNLVNGVLSVCEGSSINPNDVINNPSHPATVLSITWTLDGQAFDDSHIFTLADNGKELVVTIETTCGEATDAVTLNVNPMPTPIVEGPHRACHGDQVTFTATPNFASYQFAVNGVAQPTQSSNTFTTVLYDTDPDNETFYDITVTVTDANGCEGTSEAARIKITDQVSLIFYNADADTTENIEHTYNVTDGGDLNFFYSISTGCADYDKKIFVEWDIYYNGHLIPNDSIGEYILPRTYTNEYGEVTEYVYTNGISWLSGTEASVSPTPATYNFAQANPKVATSGNHFPNSYFGQSGNGDVFDYYYVHFVGDRKMPTYSSNFLKNGTYTFKYRVIATNQGQDFMDVYTEDNEDHDNYGSHNQHIGGQNALVSGGSANPLELTLLVEDSINIIVTGAPEVAQDAEIVVPDAAPLLTLDEDAVAPDMEVWPNPAPAITTTFKARVHNMNGEATVTIVNLTGKQIYNGKMNIDSDSYYFEASVNNLSVGTYVMSVRTADAIVTKKVIVTR